MKIAAIPVASALIIMASTLATAKGTWVCVANDAVGFQYNDGHWKGALFKADRKYFVAPKKAKWSDKIVTTVTVAGDEDNKFECKSLALGNEEPYAFDCVGMRLNGQFFFNTKSLRYSLLREAGYVGGKEFDGEDGMMPYMEIGVCSPV